MSFFDLVVPQDREASRKRHRRKMAGEPVPGLYQMGIRKKGGSTVSVELTGACTTIKKERANVIYIRNITERLESEAKLIESERHYHSLFDNMLSGIAYCEMIFKDGQPYDFRYLKVNDALEKLTGLKNVEGRTINELVPTLKESKPEIFEIYGKVASTGKSQRFEAYIDQMKLWLDISVYSTEIGYFTAIFDNISVRKQIIRDLERSEDQMRKLSQRLLAVQEEERSRIARDIHDQLVQELALMKILAVSLASKAVDDGIAAKTQQLVSLADKLINTTHRISIGLRPEMLDKLGLPKAVQWYAEEFERDSGISCPVDCQEESEDISIPRDIAIAAYRVIQEATTNIMRHSKASQANIFLNATKEMLRIKIIDNGIGFNMSKMTDESSLGLIGMRERIRAVGGVIVIKSNGKTGTRISAHFPINRGN
jgi:signal transduction histidine kinase